MIEQARQVLRIIHPALESKCPSPKKSRASPSGSQWTCSRFGSFDRFPRGVRTAGFHVRPRARAFHFRDRCAVSDSGQAPRKNARVFDWSAPAFGRQRGHHHQDLPACVNGSVGARYSSDSGQVTGSAIKRPFCLIVLQSFAHQGIYCDSNVSVRIVDILVRRHDGSCICRIFRCR